MTLVLPSIKQLAKYKWVVYPAIAGMLVVGSLLYVSSGSVDLWERLRQKNSKVEDEAKALEELSLKLEKLRTIDASRQSENLGWLLGVVPEGKQVWVVVNELQAAAGEAGTVLDSWSSNVGEISVADASASARAAVGDPQTLSGFFAVKDVRMALDVVRSIERRMPLLSLSKATYSEGQLTVVVEGVWSPLLTAVPTETRRLPEGLDAAVSQLKVKLGDFKGLNEVAGGFVSQPQGGDPF